MDTSNLCKKTNTFTTFYTAHSLPLNSILFSIPCFQCHTKCTKKNPCLYTNYHTFLSPKILHKENILVSVKCVNYLAKPNIISMTFLLQYTKSVIKMSVSPLKLYNFKHLHSVLIGTKQKLIQCFQLTYNWISSLEFLTLPHQRKPKLAKLQT
jgi:hypothetical protein